MDHYLKGLKPATSYTPALERLSIEYRITMCDLGYIKRTGNYTDFGLKQMLSKAKTVGLSAYSMMQLEIDEPSRYPIINENRGNGPWRLGRTARILYPTRKS